VDHRAAPAREVLDGDRARSFEPCLLCLPICGMRVGDPGIRMIRGRDLAGRVEREHPGFALPEPVGDRAVAPFGGDEGSRAEDAIQPRGLDLLHRASEIPLRGCSPFEVRGRVGIDVMPVPRDVDAGGGEAHLAHQPESMAPFGARNPEVMELAGKEEGADPVDGEEATVGQNAARCGDTRLLSTLAPGRHSCAGSARALGGFLHFLGVNAQDPSRVCWATS